MVKGETTRYKVPQATAATITPKDKPKMENLAATILLTAAFYLWLFAPRHTSAATATDPAAPAIAKPVTITEPLPVTNFKPKPNPVKTAPMATQTDLMNQPIRRLKFLAKGRVKNYSNLTKSQLSQRLAGIVPMAEL